MPPYRCRIGCPRAAIPSLLCAFALVAIGVTRDLPAAGHELGAAVDLRDGNGLLAVDIDALAPISAVRIERVGSLFGGRTLGGVRGGTNIRLIELPAGDYRWSRVNFDFGSREGVMRLRDEAKFHFRVESAAINYVGDLCITPAANGAPYAVSVTNRAARMLVHLDREYPGARRKYPLRYQGAFPDRFLQFAANQMGDQSASDALKSGSAALVKEEPDDAALRVLVAELFAKRQLRIARLNPRGDLVATVEYRDGRNRLSLFDARSRAAVDVYSGGAEVHRVYFSTDRTLLFELDGADGNHVVHAQTHSGAAPTFTQYAIPGRGWFIDPTLAGGSEALYAHLGSDGAAHMFRIALDRQRFDSAQFGRELRLDRGLDKAFFGLADGDAVLRLALTAVNGDNAVMYRPGAASPWREVQRYAADEVFEPVLLDGTGDSVIALTNKGRAQTDLVRMALPSGEIVGTLYSVPGTDLDGVLTRNRDRSVLGVLAWSDGNLETRYLDEPDAALRRAVERALPGKSIAVYDTNVERNRMLVLASSEVDPGSFYLFDAASAVVQELTPASAGMAHVHAVRSRVLKAVAGDGTEIESYLTLPPDAAPPYPLIVMPHGGPIGIRDGLRFDPAVQLLANRGYAVLRVNYRGSGGFGRAFEQAGLGAWGRSIEDDILAATDAALAAAPLDRDRVALRGASYGGYSTLMGLIRTPERFRCGVAISAVTDVPLLFTSSDWSQDLRSRARMRQVVGDPATALADMEAVSPDYQYHKLGRPLLIIHGALDARVPLEHALRLLLLLGHAQTPPQSLFFAHEGHGIDDPAARYQAEAAIDRFYSKCLAPKQAIDAAP